MARIISKEDAIDYYNEMVRKHWARNVEKNLAWAYAKESHELALYDHKEMMELVTIWCEAGDYRSNHKNLRTWSICGRTWHGLVIQRVGKDGDVLDSGFDAFAPVLTGFVVTGVVYYFESQDLRDLAHILINKYAKVKAGPLALSKPMSKALINLFRERGPFDALIEFNNIYINGGEIIVVKDADPKKKVAETVSEAERKAAAEAAERKAAAEAAERKAAELIAEIAAEKKPRKPSPPKKEECPLSPAELKAIPPRPPTKIRTPAGSLIDNTQKVQAWDSKYSIYRKWLK